jgi:hypothetical protein
MSLPQLPDARGQPCRGGCSRWARFRLQMIIRHRPRRCRGGDDHVGFPSIDYELLSGALLLNNMLLWGCTKRGCRLPSG